mgnify:CR=1 FL=1
MPELAKTMRNHISNADNKIMTHIDEVKVVNSARLYVPQYVPNEKLHIMRAHMFAQSIISISIMGLPDQ